MKLAAGNTKTVHETPAALGYRMPAEWEPHAATWLAWPHNRSDWPGKFEAIPWVYAEIIRHLARVERVELVVQDGKEEAHARSVLQKVGLAADPATDRPPPRTGVRLHHWPTDRSWTRDSGAIFLRRDSEPGLAAINFHFNAWAKYPDWKRDDTLAIKMARVAGAVEYEAVRDVAGQRRRLVLEGGSIDVNGQGTLLTSEECLLSEVQARNPGMTREEIEGALTDFLGVRKVIWLGRGIQGDDTHGHIDDIARFVAPDTVLASIAADPADPNYEPLQENVERLQKASDQDGHPFRVLKLPLPSPIQFEGQRLPASYANFYIANGLVLAPTFNDLNDRHALNILAEIFPDRQIVGIYCGDLIWGLGALHCMVQQQPEVSRIVG